MDNSLAVSTVPWRLIKCGTVSKQTQLKHLVKIVLVWVHILSQVIRISPAHMHLPPHFPRYLFHVVGTRHTVSSVVIVCFAFQTPPSPTYTHLHQGSGKHSSLFSLYTMIHDNLCYSYVISYASFFCWDVLLFVKTFSDGLYLLKKTTCYTSSMTCSQGCDVIGNKMCLSLKLIFFLSIFFDESIHCPVNFGTVAFMWHISAELMKCLPGISTVTGWSGEPIIFCHVFLRVLWISEADWSIKAIGKPKTQYNYSS